VPEVRVDHAGNGVPLPDEGRAAIVRTAREVGVSEVSISKGYRAVCTVIARQRPGNDGGFDKGKETE
jgi:hypothetical protein